MLHVIYRRPKESILDLMVRGLEEHRRNGVHEGRFIWASKKVYRILKNIQVDGAPLFNELQTFIDGMRHPNAPFLDATVLRLNRLDSNRLIITDTYADMKAAPQFIGLQITELDISGPHL